MIYGRGVCDIPAKIHRGHYNRWFKMFERSYSPAYLKSRPTYLGCSVSEEWHLFSRFLSWSEGNFLKGHALDKDILVPGSKVYSEETCLYVPPFINSLLTNCVKKGELPLGVYFEPLIEKYRVQIHTGSGQRKVGSFECPREAHAEWCLLKAEHIRRAVERWREEFPKSFRQDAKISLTARSEELEEKAIKMEEVVCLK